MRKKHFLIFALFAAVILIFFWKLAVLDSAFLSGDHREQQYPWAKFYQEQIRSFNLPWWTTDIHSGFPILAEGQIGAFYPLNYFFFLLLPAKAAYNYLILFQYWLGAVLLFLYLRRLKLSIFPAFFASLIYLFGSTQGGYFYYNYISQKTVLWLPLTLILTGRLEEHKRWRDAFWLAAVFAVQIFAGYLQVAIYSVLFSVLYFLWTCARKWSPRFLFLFAGAGILGIFFSLCQLLPTLELSFLSSRSGAEKGLAYVGSMNPLGLMTLFYPSWDAFLSSEFYISLLGLFFFIYAAFTPKLPQEKFFIFSFAFFLLLALGKFSPLYRLLVETTGFNGFRTPIKFLFFVSFSAIVLAAFGLQKFIDSFSNKAFTKTRLAYGILTALFLALPVASLTVMEKNRETLLPKLREIVVSSFYGKAGHPHSREHYLQKAISFYDNVTHTLSFSEPDTRREWTYLAAALFFILFLLPRVREQKAFPVILTLLLLADLYGYGGTSIRANQEPFNTIDTDTGIKNPIVKTIQDTPGLFRVMEVYKEGRENRIYPVFPCSNMLDHIQDFGAYSPLVLREYQNFVKGWGYINNSLGVQWVDPAEVLKKIPMLGLLNVRYILSTTQLQHASLWEVMREGEVYLYENQQTLPRAFFVSSTTSLKKMEDVPFSGLTPVTEIKQTQQSVDLTFSAPASGLLVVTDIYYKNWRVWVDGREAAIEKAGEIFRGVRVEAGPHQVLMKYDPVLYRRLAYAALLLFLLGFAVILKTPKTVNYEK